MSRKLMIYYVHKKFNMHGGKIFIILIIIIIVFVILIVRIIIFIISITMQPKAKTLQEFQILNFTRECKNKGHALIRPF